MNILILCIFIVDSKYDIKFKCNFIRYMNCFRSNILKFLIIDFVKMEGKYLVN